jgi:hypothetical protein
MNESQLSLVAAVVHICGKKKKYARFGDCQLLVASSSSIKVTGTNNVQKIVKDAARELSTGFGSALLRDEWSSVEKKVFSVD